MQGGCPECTDLYAPEEERGAIWNDPGIGIAWPLGSEAPLLSEKDRRYTPLSRVDAKDLPVYPR